MFEVNFDGMVGPSHHYGGLALGDLASMGHAGEKANPMQAALEGLEKMRLLVSLGVKQGYLPAPERPRMDVLKSLGFESVEEARKKDPRLLSAVSSASSMWAANAGTFTPSVDSGDGRMHLSVANLSNTLHRSLEAEERLELFRKIFPEVVVHEPLPAPLCDEGAANHVRLCKEHGEPGVHLFVYGRELEERGGKFPRRQVKEASEAIVRRHKLPEERVVFARQNPEVIDQGVFHNDVIATGNERLFIYHEHAFAESERALAELQEKFPSLEAVCVKEKDFSVRQAVETYLFNSQIVSLPSGDMCLIAPKECEGLDLSFIPVEKVIFSDVRQSMKNGGGPACLRLRLVMSEKELSGVDQSFILNAQRLDELESFVRDTYPQEKVEIKGIF